MEQLDLLEHRCVALAQLPRQPRLRRVKLGSESGHAALHVLVHRLHLDVQLAHALLDAVHLFQGLGDLLTGG